MADDPVNNIKFVELVEQYPCLYDYNCAEYSKRELKEKAWTAIAKDIKDSVGNCKEKWKHLRTAFSRSLKKPPSGSGASKTIKDYYLKEVMQFVLPFLKIKPQSGNLSHIETESETPVEDIFNDSSFNDEDSNQQNETEGEMSQGLGMKEGRSSSLASRNKTTINENDTSLPIVKKPKITKKLDNDLDKCVMNYMASKTSMPKSNPDLDFFKSLLPDVGKMTDYQKRLFRRKTLELIDSILCDFPNETMQVTQPLPSPAISSYTSASYSTQCSPAPSLAEERQLYNKNDNFSYSQNSNDSNRDSDLRTVITAVLYPHVIEYTSLKSYEPNQNLVGFKQSMDCPHS